MALINYATREINAKIVYYGPGLSGKTTNIHYVFKKIKPGNKGKLVSLATQGDRTLFFDFLPVELGNIKGFKTRFHLYTVPGQVFYNSTRKMVLKGSDGVVFVADSQRMMMDEDLQSLDNLKANLKDMGQSFEKFPLVIQYNKRDLPNAAPIEELNEFLNPSGLPYFEASAIAGDGVLKTLTAVVKFVLHDLRETPDTHSLDFAALEEAADSMTDGPSPLFLEGDAAAPGTTGVPAKHPAAGARVISADFPERAAGNEAGEAVDAVADITSPEYVHAAIPETAGDASIPGFSTVEASASDHGGQDVEVELPEASPEIFSSFGRPDEGVAGDEEVYDAVEVLDGLGEMIMEDGPAEPHVKTLGEFMDTNPPVETPETSEAGMGTADDFLDIPDDFHPDLDADLTEGIDLAAMEDAPETNEGYETRPTEHAEAGNRPPNKGMRVRKSFKLPVKLATRSGIKEVVLNLNVDMEITGEGLDAVEAAELMELARENGAQAGEPRHEKDQSKHPPPAAPDNKRKNAEITEPLIRIRKKGMLEKMFGR